MYVRNTKVSNAAMGHWRVDPDNRQDRRDGPVTVRAMTEEEAERYGVVQGYKKPTMVSVTNLKRRSEVKVNHKLDVDVNRMLEICREHGTGVAAGKIIGEEYGLTVRQAVNLMKNRKIKEKLAEERTWEVFFEEMEALPVEEVATVAEKNSTRFYIASRLENAAEVQKLAKILSKWGWEHTYDWTAHGSVEGQGDEVMARVAAAEMEGVTSADVVIVLLPGGRGTHAEMGAAIASGKRVILWQDVFTVDDGYPCAFYYHKNVKRVTGSSFDLLIELEGCADSQ